MFALRYFATAAGRSQPIDFLGALQGMERASIVADIEAYRVLGRNAPVSWKPIKGYAPMFEIRTRGFRTYCVVEAGVLWVLHVGRKQDQRRDIENAAKRMKLITGG